MQRLAAAALIALAAILCGGAGAGGQDEEAPPPLLSQTGLYLPGGRELNPRLIAFAPRYPLWTDGAAKARWILLPPGGAIDASDPDNWRFPVGTRVWKAFAFAGRPVETRFMRRLADGSWQYATYAFDEDGAQARLVGPGGRRRGHALGGGRFHALPGTADCKACHEGQPAPVLGFSAVQLAGELADLAAAGVITGLPPALLAAPPRIAARGPLEEAALGYLHGNCGHCHNPAGPLANLGLVLRQPVGGQSPALATTLSVPARRLASAGKPRIAPGDPDASLLLERAASRVPALQMPPLGTAVVDEDAVRLLRAWIAQLEPAPPSGDLP